jgi:hypothetical protein
VLKTKVLAVFGYNNSRIYDLNNIRKLAHEKCGAEILLIKEDIVDADRAASQFCFDHAPDDARMAKALKNFLSNNNLELVGCLPFSDKGVIGAAHVANELGLVGDDAPTSFAMLDKMQFRVLEQSITIDSELYKKPFFFTAYTNSEIKNLFEAKGSLFIKPRAEGNSRGCMKIENVEQLDEWLVENKSFIVNGVICEEVLSDSNEYSYDGVSGSYWITQKFTTSGSYRAEYQHIMPAPLSSDVSVKLHKIFRPLLSELGSRGGAFHHEFFKLSDGRFASVEPNRRPAGMWIWDLASWAFRDFNPWIQWIDHCSGAVINEKELVTQSFAGVRGIISKKSGTLKSIDEQEIALLINQEFGKENVRISFLKKVNAQVRDIPRDNSDFLAFIAIKNPDYNLLCKSLEQAEAIFLKNCEISA